MKIFKINIKIKIKNYIKFLKLNSMFLIYKLKLKYLNLNLI
jgi:hypothetical protein